MFAVLIYAAIWCVLPLASRLVRELLAHARHSLFPHSTSVKLHDSLMPQSPHIEWAELQATHFSSVKVHLLAHAVSVIGSALAVSFKNGAENFMPLQVGAVFLSLDVLGVSLVYRWPRATLVPLFLSYLIWPICLFAFLDMGGVDEGLAVIHLAELMFWGTLAIFVDGLSGWRLMPKHKHTAVGLGIAAIIVFALVRILKMKDGLVWSDSFYLVFLMIPLSLLWSKIVPGLESYRKVFQSLAIIYDENLTLRETISALQDEIGMLKKRNLGEAKLAHEVRTPLSSILHCCTLLEDTSLTPLQKEFVEMTTTACMQISDNIEFVLDMARMHAGSVQLKCRPMNVQRTCSEAMNAVRHLAEQKHLQLRLNLCPKCKSVTLKGDPSRLKQALLNLLTNSIKFTSSGAIVMNVSILTHDELNPTAALLRIEISDSGIGMTPEQQARLFHPFVQASETTFDQFGGTGLGLCITRQILELMGGTISIDPERTAPGLGSTFVIDILLPRTESSVQKCLAATTSPSTPSVVHQRLMDLIPAIPRPRSGPTSRSASVASSSAHPSASSTYRVGGGPSSSRGNSVDGGSSPKNPSTPSTPSVLSPSNPLCALNLSGVLPSTNPDAHSSGCEDGGMERQDSTDGEEPSSPSHHHKVRASSRLVLQLEAEVGFRDATVVSPPREIVANETIQKELFAPFRVLLVDDNVLSNLIMKKLMLSIGFTNIVSATGVKQAMVLFVGSPAIDVIVTDLSMPDGSGIELAADIRNFVTLTSSIGFPAITQASFEFPTSSHTLRSPPTLEFVTRSTHQGNNEQRQCVSPRRQPFILGLSGASDPDTVNRCFQVGLMNAFLSKPVSREQLVHLFASKLLNNMCAFPGCVDDHSHPLPPAQP